KDWLKGDPTQPPPPAPRAFGRNHTWWHLNTAEVISMPDTWEYPWFAAWDLAFHTIPLALIDPDFAKAQLILLTREWYMHPNGQLPAYEWAFSDVNPPVHAWAAMRVYQIEQKMYGRSDRRFLERVFQKLLLNFTWWVNRKDAEDNNVFEGGFLGLDNIGAFDRNLTFPSGGILEQADSTSWMAMFCLNMLRIALVLAEENPAYEDIATKFFEHFIYIADAINHLGGTGLWNEADGFYYDMFRLSDGRCTPMRVRSMVGLIPLFAIITNDPQVPTRFPDYGRRVRWFMKYRPELAKNIANIDRPGVGARALLALVGPEKLRRMLTRALDESRLLSPHGIRSVSKHHREHPFIFQADGNEYQLDYEPAESTTGMFGGNSNWRGPIWFPLNYLLIESLQQFHYYLGDDYHVECPTGSGREATLWEVATELSRRLLTIFLKDESGRRPLYGGIEKFQTDPQWRDLILFHEYFHGDNGAGLGAGHQTGWTGLIAKLIQQYGEYCLQGKPPQLIEEE
ncbi:MAG TPA: glucosidase, partial [Candidatus Competibacteraceae bacterium]|nr:glucosidase [Candidatus Competibacteraceae bacterium]